MILSSNEYQFAQESSEPIKIGSIVPTFNLFPPYACSRESG